MAWEARIPVWGRVGEDALAADRLAGTDVLVPQGAFL